MAARTEQFKSAGSNLGRTLGQSLSMITGKDIPNYSLLFLDASISRKRGEHETIFMPHIVLGRSTRCHVRFGDEHKTVSREHASITVDGSNFVINHNPSASNPTYVNGRAIGGAHHLQNGDEIQLSSNGPKMRFNASTLKTSTIGLTSRIGKAMSQAVKPYKTALWVMGLLLVGSLAFSGWNMYKLSNTEKAYKMEIDSVRQQVIAGKLSIEEANKKIEEISKKEQYVPLIGSGRVKPNSDKDNDGIQDNLDKCPNDYGIMKCYGCPTCTELDPDPFKTTVDFSDLPSDDVYYIYALRVEAAMNGEIEYVNADQVWPGEKRAGLWGGTGFLTDENLFITARHVVQPWRYPNSDWMKRLSYLEANGAILSVTFEALSRNGDKFTFTTNNSTYDDSSDELVNNKMEYKGQTLEYISKEYTKGSSDWAFIKMNNRKGKIKINRNLSKNLPTGTRLYPVGYSYTLKLQPNGDDLKPLLSECITAQDKLTNGVINTALRGFGPGNSGGPVFINIDGKFEVVGIVSAGLGSEIGIIVPVSNLW